MAIVFDDIGKLIIVEAPQTATTIQEIYNAIRDWEEEIENLDIEPICVGSGKQDLGSGVQVGITLQLINNWRLMFQDRTGPDYVWCKVSGGNLVATNIYSNNPIKPSAFTQITISQSSSATIAEGSGADPKEIAEYVWNEPKASHTDPTAFGGEVQTHATTSELTATQGVITGAISTSEGVVTGAISTSETNIRGGTDTLDTLSDQSDVLLGKLEEILDNIENKLTINTATSELCLWNDAGTSIIKKWPITDKDGNPIVLTNHGPVNRGKRTL